MAPGALRTEGGSRGGPLSIRPLAFLPLPHRPGNNPEERMLIRTFDLDVFRQQSGSAPGQLCLEMPPLVEQLAACLHNADRRPAFSDFTSVECIAPPHGLGMNGGKISRDCGNGIRMLPKTRKLRMMQISPGPAAQDGLSQQPFPPEAQQALPVQILRIYGPNSHRSTRKGEISSVPWQGYDADKSGTSAKQTATPCALRTGSALRATSPPMGEFVSSRRMTIFLESVRQARHSTPYSIGLCKIATGCQRCRQCRTVR